MDSRFPTAVSSLRGGAVTMLTRFQEMLPFWVHIGHEIKGCLRDGFPAHSGRHEFSVFSLGDFA